MYLSFDRKTKELINYSDDSDYSIINRNKYGIVYYDDYTVIVKRDDIDFIETYYDEESRLNVLVQGQHTLSDEINDFLKIFQYAEEIRKKGCELMKEKLNRKTEILPLSYVIYLGQLSLKEVIEYSPEEMLLSFDRQKTKELFNESIRLCDAVNNFGGKFLTELEKANSRGDIDKAFDDLRSHLE